MSLGFKSVADFDPDEFSLNRWAAFKARTVGRRFFRDGPLVFFLRRGFLTSAGRKPTARWVARTSAA